MKGGGVTECRSAQWNSGAVVLEGVHREGKWFQIGSYKKTYNEGHEDE